MIPRYQRILFIVLLSTSVFMAIFLVYMHRKNFADVKNADHTPLEAPVYSASEQVTLDLADDSDFTLTPTTRSIALPQTAAVRARALVEHLLAEYSLPRSTHPLDGGIAVDDVFLVPLPLGSAPQRASLTKEAQADPLTQANGELAVVNLRSSWVDGHPAGITSETLTIQSIVGTLRANLPEITKVKFLVDGKPRDTLAGSVEFDRIFDADAAITAPVQTATHD
ncbi:GerMN domain-containing protein [Terriglobus sp. RCC_193]|uniref:GerMN domain-containing protein n=1 Tax=Terriglobus sp. RCC_193 TaxID=3239218 RepID=UPI0035261BBB